ncbi:hypothetical protein PBT90_13140 [Algoriphagus halophytocola]|uniref:hypothetical protein n=1 Tax=Algoriphagus halophytocola TaxID=2991499 RepID=UPI0022DD6D77|nr:hypothetical protein [Algoriphagus sp. TR-M9]WBL41699.1 hypothetical protein PBT90_13140 [Algoriphagus sp. TR-M9]
MAKNSNNLDKFFKERLEDHTVAPSHLAWERLEAKLPQKSNSNLGIWWAAAASLTIILTAGYFLMKETESENTEPLLAENKTETVTEQPKTSTDTPTVSDTTDLIESTENTTEEKPQTTENQQATPNTNTKPTIPAQQETEKPADSSASFDPVDPASTHLVAMEEEKPKAELIPQVEISTPEIEPLEVIIPQSPELSLENSLADATPEEEEPAYRVKIYSSGLKEEPKDKNLIAGIGKTVNEVEGLLNKVDQGFADLQDAKNNLFATITSKKSRSEE